MTDDRRTPDLEQDKYELASSLRQRAETEARGLPPAELSGVIARGRALRRRNRSALALAATAALLFTAVAGPRIGAALQSSLAADTAPSGFSEEEASATAATFAIRAIAEAGLMNPLDDYYTYRAVEGGGTSWQVRFTSSSCFRARGGESCEALWGSGEDVEDNDTYLDVRIRGGWWFVAAIEGPMEDDARAAVLSYQEPVAPIAPHPEFAPVVLREPLDPAAGGEGLEAHVPSYWAGPIPERRITFACRLVAFGDSGAVVHEGHAHAYEAATSERERGGSVLATGLPPDVDASRAEMRCERFTGPGWELLEQPAIRPAAGDRAVHVDGEVVWRDRFVAGVDLDCSLQVLDARGAIVGERRFPMASPWAPDDAPPLTRRIDAVVDVDGGAAAADSVAFSCVVPEPPIGEPRDRDPERDDHPDEDETDRAVRPEDRPAPPDGPRHTLASGSFEGAEWGDYDGEMWGFQVWANDVYRCWRFAVGEELDGNSGRLCTHEPPEVEREHLGGHGYHPAASFDGDRAVAYGEVGNEVARVKFELSTGTSTEVDALIPPPELSIDARYFVAFLEPSESYEIVALDAEGRELQRKGVNP